MKFDLEVFKEYYLTIIQNNMSAKIAAISTEKNDGISLPIPTANQYISFINAGAWAFDPLIHYGFNEIETESNGQNVKYTAQMFFAFYFLDFNDGIAEKKVFRYTRAMTEILAENSKSNAYVSNLQILPLPAATVKFEEQDGSIYKVGAVELKGSFIA